MSNLIFNFSVCGFNFLHFSASVLSFLRHEFCWRGGGTIRPGRGLERLSDDLEFGTISQNFGSFGALRGERLSDDPLGSDSTARRSSCF